MIGFMKTGQKIQIRHLQIEDMPRDPQASAKCGTRFRLFCPEAMREVQEGPKTNEEVRLKAGFGIVCSSLEA